MSDIHSIFQPSRILCPMDTSELSELALRYAAAAALAYGAELTVLHAEKFSVPPYFTKGQIATLTEMLKESRQAALSFLQGHVEAILGNKRQKLSLHVVLEEKDPVESILSHAQKGAADLLVLGTHGRTGAKRLWLGSVTENVVRHAEVPVLVVRKKQHEWIDSAPPGGDLRMKTILCPVNFTDTARAALKTAAVIASRFGAKLVPICVIEEDSSVSIAQMDEKLKEWIREDAPVPCITDVSVRKGHAAEQILSSASQMQADLVVLGAQRADAQGGWPWGNTTELVLRQSPVPVLVIPRETGIPAGAIE
jgi:nucleotide-binding universal stress UspA family protein